MIDKQIQHLNKDPATGLEFNDDGFAVNTDGNAFFSGPFRDILVGVTGSGNVIVYGTNQQTPPDFSLASVIGNFYAPIVLADYSVHDTYYDGVDGVSVSDESKLVELNTNLLTYIGILRDSDTVDVVLTQTNAL